MLPFFYSLFCSVGNEFASMFTTFINNKLDKLVTPKEIVTGPVEVLEQVKECIGKDDNYRADIASLQKRGYCFY